MDNDKSNHLSRAQKVNGFLKDNVKELAATPDVNLVLQPKLETLLQKILDDDSLATAVNTGYAAQGNLTRSLMNDSMFHWASAFVSHADDVHDMVMLHLFDIPFSTIQAFSKSKAVQFADIILKKAADPILLAELKLNHNILATDVATLTSLRNSYNDNIAAPQQSRGEKTAYGNIVDQDFVELEALRLKISRKINTHRSTNKLLYDGFYEVNSIDDFGHGKKTFTVVGTVLLNQTVLGENIEYSAAKHVIFKNTGSVVIDFLIYKSGKQIGTTIVVDPGGVYTGALGDIATDGDSFYIHNGSSTTACTYEITY